MKKIKCCYFYVWVGLWLAAGLPTVWADDPGTITAGVYTIDPSTEIQAENHLVTSLPSALGGLNVGTYLGADAFYNAGINGQGAIAANVEAGHIWSGHETLGHVSTFVHDADAFGTTTAELVDRHATWVGVMIGGRNGGVSQGDWQTGISPDADLRSGAIATSWVGAPYSLSFSINGNSFNTPYDTYFGSADVINSSWGFTDPSGMNFFTIATDGFAADNPNTTLVVSAGNSGAGANTVGAPGAGYNAITVGALLNDSFNNYDGIAGFSSRGPQDYGDPINGTVAGVRAAVDITAPGHRLTGAFYGGTTGGNTGGSATGGPNSYTPNLQGTSFSSPIVAGATTLLASASYNTGLAANANSRDARVLKSVLLNSADKVPGWTNGQVANGSGGVDTTQSLDYTYGAGRVNLNQAYDQYLSGTTDVAGTGSGNLGTVLREGWDYGMVNFGSSNDYFLQGVLNAGTEFRVTLDWFRNRTYNPGLFTATDAGQANLDLFVFDATGGAVGSMISSSISTYNVVEHLAFNIPTTGAYGIRVSYLSDVFGVSASTLYGLSWSGIGADVFIPEPGSLVLLLLLGVMMRVAGTLRRR